MSSLILCFHSSLPENCVSRHWMVELGSKKFWHGLNYLSNFTTLCKIKGHDHTYHSMCLGFPILACGTEITKVLYLEVQIFPDKYGDKIDQDGRFCSLPSLQNFQFMSWIFLQKLLQLLLFLFHFWSFRCLQLFFSKPHYMLILDHNCTDS